MLNQIDKLIKNLKNLIGAYISVKEIFSEKYRLLSSGNIEGLIGNIAKTDSILSEIKSLESQRQAILLEISLESKINLRDLNVSKLKQLFPKKADELNSLQGQILDLLSEIKVADYRSSRFIKNNLEQIKWLLMALNQDIENLSIYSKDYSQSNSYSLFDEKA